MRILFAILIFLAIAQVKAQIYVPDDFSTIQQAINNASEGDTIVVRNGTYSENVLVDKRLNIVCEGECILNAKSIRKPAFDIEANGVNISGFTIQNAKGYMMAGIRINGENCNVSNNVVRNNYVGIYLKKSDGNRVENNVIANNKFGIKLYYSKDNTIKNNTLQNNGIIIDGGFEDWKNTIENNTVNGKKLYYLIGIRDVEIRDAGQVMVFNCSNVTLKDFILKNSSVGVLIGFSDKIRIENVSSFNNYYGLLLHNSKNVTIINCNFSKNDYGIFIRYSNKNFVVATKVEENSKAGIKLWYSKNNRILNCSIASNKLSGIHAHESPNNLIENNSIVKNHDGVYLYASDKCRVVNNVVDQNQVGMHVSSKLSFMHGNRISSNFFGILIENEDNTIARNNLTANSIAIMIKSNDNTIIQNNVSLSKSYGIEVEYAENNTITRNNVLFNNVGIDVRQSNNNTVFLNNFENTIENAISYNSSNRWNSLMNYTYNGKNFTGCLGNYYGDYSGTDANNDGVGDAAYKIGEEIDECPLIDRFEEYVT